MKLNCLIDLRTPSNKNISFELAFDKIPLGTFRKLIDMQMTTLG
jgi:hypothetical protein